MHDDPVNLLRDPVIRIGDATGRITPLTLPGVLAMLSHADAESFVALRAHQVHGWYAFLVQLAAIALHRAAYRESPSDESTWCELLRALTGGSDEPWSLVVADLSVPAFLQPPVPEGTLAGFKECVSAPDDIDILVTTKNHDVKRACVNAPSVDHWVYALVSLQTMQGYSGSKSYGIARMNKGLGNRPCVTFAPGPSWGARFRRDVPLLLAGRARLVEGSYGYPADGGLALLWLEPWDGTTSLALTQCDPFFIEICRRIRLTWQNGRLVAHLKPTEGPRIDGDENKGDTGDPWTPVRVRDGAALTVGEGGFTYDLVRQLLLGGDYRLGLAAELTPHDGDRLFFHTATLARGQGETNGYHERWLPIPPQIRRRLGSTSERDRIAALAKHRVAQVGTVWRRVLHPALCTLLQGAPDRLDLRDERTQRWREGLERAVDRIFFERLWADSVADEAEADRRWLRELAQFARAELENAITSAPVAAARRFRAVAAAERVFFGAWRNQFGPIEWRATDDGTRS